MQDTKAIPIPVMVYINISTLTWMSSTYVWEFYLIHK